MSSPNEKTSELRQKNILKAFSTNNLMTLFNAMFPDLNLKPSESNPRIPVLDPSFTLFSDNTNLKAISESRAQRNAEYLNFEKTLVDIQLADTNLNMPSEELIEATEMMQINEDTPRLSEIQKQKYKKTVKPSASKESNATSTAKKHRKNRKISVFGSAAQKTREYSPLSNNLQPAAPVDNAWSCGVLGSELFKSPVIPSPSNEPNLTAHETCHRLPAMPKLIEIKESDLKTDGFRYLNHEQERLKVAGLVSIFCQNQIRLMEAKPLPINRIKHQVNRESPLNLYNEPFSWDDVDVDFFEDEKPRTKQHAHGVDEDFWM